MKPEFILKFVFCGSFSGKCFYNVKRRGFLGLYWTVARWRTLEEAHEVITALRNLPQEIRRINHPIA